ncbi:MAG: hypothetical protein JO280_11285 [Mycobacteriaceae bacterium]|nr:hypothetical protein [Mycobacteriaceae bacterium]
MNAVRFVAAAVLVAIPVLAGITPRAAAGEPGDTRFLEVRIDRVTPDVVTTTGDSTVTVSGTVINVGDRPVHDIVVRLEHAAAVTSPQGLRTNLDGATDQYEPVGDFVDVANELQRGQAGTFNLSFPVRSTSKPSLGIDQPGVYPLLVNANGTPDYGDPARLDDGRFLLPVLGVPADPSVTSADPLAGVVAPDTAKPVTVTMLWPLADRPRLAAGAPGGVTPVRLIDDELAGSLAPGGRLDTLLSAADFATGPAVDPGGRVNGALCLAVDPDLLVTVNAMSAGYVVSDKPDDRNSPTHPGTGQAAAAAWLDRLRSLAHRMCVAPTPYAQADLDALHRIGDPGLAAIATNGAGDVVDQILGVTSTRGATVLGDGFLTSGAAELLGAQGPTVAIAAAECTAHDEIDGKPRPANVDPRRLSADLVAAPFDPTVGAAFAAAGRTPASPSYLDASLVIPNKHDSPTARRQDAISAMLWLGLNPDNAPRTQILVPPPYWDLQAADAETILTALATAIHAGLAEPRPLSALVTDSEAAAVPGAQLPGDANRRGRLGDQVTTDIGQQIGRLWGLTAAMTTDPRTGLTGLQYTAPLREDMLRALSQAVAPEGRDGQAQQRMAAVDTTVNDMFHAVTIVNPGGSYTLATEHSPLPLALHNDLAVPIKVRLQVDAPPGMTVTDIGVQELPPGYLPLRVPIEVHFTQRVAVDVTLRTPDGLTLGEPVRLSVHSNAYGKVLFAITMAAAAVLVVLAGRRLWHRFRGQPDPADLDRPEPG